ncbi:hypothetical protein [Acinetobacter johnsonii]|uniref:Uncharacterized protein n=1 Tax=Acinetobacter johnsonii TaxID=40214 RepID=A0AAJ6IIB0_ACIJO|nr:hypothetical protein [Acinetobacter johnsonii]WMG20102.1 hypothetical protein QBJ73_19150 [Acinetobacter johnsonii]
MNRNSKEIYKNIGEAVVDTAMGALDVMTFGTATNVLDLADKIGTHYQNLQKLHAIKQLEHFYKTPSRLWSINLKDFKKEHKDYEEIVLDLLKTLDLTIHRNQSEMLARLFECYVLNEINTAKFHHLKYIIVKLDQHLINTLESYLPDQTITTKKFDLEYEALGGGALYRNDADYTQEEVAYDRKIWSFFSTKKENVPQELINFGFYDAIEIPLTMDLEKLPQQEYKPTRFFLWFVTHILRDNDNN